MRQYHQLSHDVRTDVSVGIDQRVTHADLGRQMHYMGHIAMRCKELTYGLGVGNVNSMELEGTLLSQLI